MSPRLVFLVYVKELRETLRDKRTLLIMVLLPLVLYPVMVLLIGQGLTAESLAHLKATSRVGFDGETWPELEQAVRRADKTERMGRASEATLRQKQVDLVVVVGKGVPARFRAGESVTLELLHDRTRERSGVALDRVKKAVAAFGDQTRAIRLKARGLPEGFCRPVTSQPRDIAGSRALGAKILAGALPLLVVLMVLLGAFYPAIDLTAGEKERGTLETLLVAPVRRLDLITGKFLVVATVALVTGFLNMGSIAVSFGLGLRSTIGHEKLPIELPWSALPLTVLALLPAALFYAALMVAVAALARSFKEAQNILTPIYMVCMMPAVVAMLPWVEMSPLLSVVPAVNVALLTREIIAGNLKLGPLLLCLGSSALYTALALRGAASIYESERLLFAPDSLLRRLRGAGARPLSEAPEPIQAAILLLLVMGLVLLVGQPLQAYDLSLGLLVTEWVLIALPCVLLARFGRIEPRTMFSLRRPSGSALVGAALLGLSGWLLVGTLVEAVQQRILPIPKELLEQMEALLFAKERPLVADLVILALSPALCEELLFRGVVLRASFPRLGFVGAILLNGLLFGLFHFSIYRFMPTLLLGVVLAALTLRTGSIIPSMLFHLLNNGCAVLVGHLFGSEQDALETTSWPLIVGAALVFGLGLFILAKGRRLERADQEKTTLLEKNT